jgi:transposase-like protein
VLLCADAAAASADLAGGLLGCPSCGTGRLRRWGHGRERKIRLRDGATARLWPDRARCRSCGRTHILLPSWSAPRRADALEVIGAAMGGAGSARIGADLGVPSGTMRGWLRRLRSRAEDMRCYAMHQLGRIGGTDLALPESAASPLHDAVNAVAGAAQAAITGHGFGAADLWPLLAGSAWPATSCPPAPDKHPRQPAHRHARSPAASLTMTITVSPVPRTATP